MKRLKVMEAADARLFKPIDNIFGLDKEEWDMIQKYCSDAWKRSRICFDKIKNPNYSGEGICPYYAEQYVVYCYFLSNSIWKCISEMDDKTRMIAQTLCDKSYMTSSMISGMDLYYGMEMPSVFLIGHPRGAVLNSNAQVKDYFLFMQGCNIGGNKGKMPRLGKGVIMWGNSKIIGDCDVGDYVMMSANSYIKDMDIPSNSIVFGQYPNVIIKENREDEILSMLHERFYM